MRKSFRVGIVFLLFLLLSVSCESPFSRTGISLQNGMLDLSGMRAASNPVFALRGEWRFYPGALPDDTIQKPARITSFQEGWIQSFSNNRGYGTYVFTFDREKETEPAIYTGVIGSAHAVSIRDLTEESFRLLGDSGRPGRNREEESPSMKPQLLDLGGCDRCEVAILISNFHHGKGGPHTPVLFGNRTALERYTETVERVDWGLAGLLVAVALMHFILFLFRMEYQNLWFSITTLLLAIRTILMSHSLELLFPSTPLFELVNRVEYSVYYIGVPMIAAYFASLFKTYLPMRLVLLLTIISLPFMYLGFFGDILVSTSINQHFHFITGITVVWIFTGILRSFRLSEEKRIESTWILIGFLFVAGTVLHDIIMDLFTPNIFPLTRYGWLVFIFSQSALIGIGNAKIWNSLRYLQRNLHREIREKTSHLEEAVRELTTKNEILHRELSLAQEIQHSFFPALPHTGKYFTADGFYLPRESVGGDYFDFITMADGTELTLFADASGHGIPAAFVTAMARIHFGELVGKEGSPSEMMEIMNESMLLSLSTIEYLTGIIFSLDAGRRFIYSNVSHPAPILLKKDGSEILSLETTGGVFIGALENSLQSYSEKEIQLEAGDRILFFSDGISEQRSRSGEEYGSTPLQKNLYEEKDLPIRKTVQSILEDWNRHREDVNQSDDASLLIIELL